MVVKAIVFDFGNVIGFFDHQRATGKLAALAGAPEKEVHAFLFGSELDVAFESGKLSVEEFLELLRSQWGLACHVDEVAAAYADIFWPNREVCEMVPRLKPRYRILLGSNTSELHSRHFLRQFEDTLRHFDGFVLSHRVGARKPSAIFYEHCHRTAGCAPRECVFIDDLPANVAGAEACGLKAILYTGVDDLRRRLGEFGVVV